MRVSAISEGVDFHTMYGIVRCEECGGVRECSFAERDIVALCKCPGKAATKARSAFVMAPLRKERVYRHEVAGLSERAASRIGSWVARTE